MKRKHRKNNLILPLVIILITLLITVGYSVVQTKLAINSNISASIYNISWANITTTEGSITPSTTPSITNNKTEVKYSLNFTNPGDFYEFSFDTTNNGSSDVMIKSISSLVNDSDISNLPSILEYTVTYSDGTQIGLKDYLKIGNDAKEAITIKVKLKDNATSSEISNLNQPINFKFIIDYVKADSTAKKVVHGIHCTYDGNMVQGAEYTNGSYTYVYMKEYGDDDDWVNITDDGWGVAVLDGNSEDPIATELCTTINGKPIVSMRNMFAYTSAQAIDFSSFVTSNVKDMAHMFESNETSTLDLSNFDTSNVEDMSSMFEQADVESIDLTNFNTSNVIDMSDMFYNCKNLTTLDLSNFDTSNVVTTENMFYNCDGLTTLNVSSFNTSNITNMSGMFGNVKKVTTLNTSKFDTSKVTDMSAMFLGITINTLDLSNFDTSKVTTMADMFSGTKTTNINLLSFDTSKVTTMLNMFYDYTGTTLDISSFNTSNVTQMSYMFYRNTNLTTIYVGSGWSVAKVSTTTSTNMFTGDTKLPHFSSYYTDKTRATTNSRTGYLTLKS